MKKIINNPMMFVQDTLCGIYYAHQDEVTFTDGSRKAMVKKQRKPRKVALCRATRPSSTVCTPL